MPPVTSCQFAMISRTISPKPSMTSTKYGPRSRSVIRPTRTATTTTATRVIGAASQKLSPAWVRSTVEQ